MEDINKKLEKAKKELDKIMNKLNNDYPNLIHDIVTRYTLANIDDESRKQILGNAIQIFNSFVNDLFIFMNNYKKLFFMREFDGKKVSYDMIEKFVRTKGSEATGLLNMYFMALVSMYSWIKRYIVELYIRLNFISRILRGEKIRDINNALKHELENIDNILKRKLEDIYDDLKDVLKDLSVHKNKKFIHYIESIYELAKDIKNKATIVGRPLHINAEDQGVI